MADCQDWEPVIFRKKNSQKTAADIKKNPHNQSLVVKSGHNNRQTKQPTRKILDGNDDEDYVRKVKKYDVEFRKRMQEARKEKNLTQKQLAARLNVKPALIGEIENGKAEWDGPLVNKIERTLGSLRK